MSKAEDARLSCCHGILEDDRAGAVIELLAELLDIRHQTTGLIAGRNPEPDKEGFSRFADRAEDYRNSMDHSWMRRIRQRHEGQDSLMTYLKPLCENTTWKPAQRRIQTADLVNPRSANVHSVSLITLHSAAPMPRSDAGFKIGGRR